MKTKKLSKKLGLSKLTVANLDSLQQKGIKGGHTCIHFPCETEWATCEGLTCGWTCDPGCTSPQYTCFVQDTIDCP